MVTRLRFIFSLVSLLLGALSIAQEVRPGDLSGLGRLRKQYENAAENAEYHDWPHLRDGDKGTVVCLTYDVSNLDVTLITSRTFPIARLTEEGRKILASMDRRKGTILTLPGQSTVGVDLELNPYIERQRFARRLELDLAALGTALIASDLPRPIHVGITFERGMQTVVQLGTKKIEGKKAAFFTPEELGAGSRMTAEARASWWILPGLLFGLGMLVLVYWSARLIKAGPNEDSETTSEAKPMASPEEVQQAYDRSRPAILYLLPMFVPVLLCGFMDVQAAFISFEILSPVPFEYVMGGYMALLLGGVLVMVLRTRARQKKLEQEVPASASLSWLSIFIAPAFVMAIGMAFLTLVPAYTAQQMEWRRFGIRGLLAVAALSAIVMAIRVWRRRVIPSRITEGPIYDTTMELARLAGTRVRGIRIVESETINASASLTAVVGVTRGLLEKMTPEEIRAVLAHEVGHLAHRHVPRILLITLPLTAGIYYGWFKFTDWLEPRVTMEMYAVFGSGIIPMLILNGIVAAAVSPYRRRLERDADAFAVRSCGDPELVIRTLVKLHTLNASPHRLKPHDEAVASHPSLVNRIAAIRAATG